MVKLGLVHFDYEIGMQVTLTKITLKVMVNGNDSKILEISVMFYA